MATLKDSTYNSPSALTITLASLASSTAGVGRVSTQVDNTSNLYNRVEVSASIKLGTSPTANLGIYVYLVRSNNAGTPIVDDGAGASDSGQTFLNAQLIGVLNTGPSPSTGTVLSGNFLAYDVGAKYSIGIVNSSGVALDATGGNHVVSVNGITITVA